MYMYTYVSFIHGYLRPKNMRAYICRNTQYVNIHAPKNRICRCMYIYGSPVHRMDVFRAWTSRVDHSGSSSEATWRRKRLVSTWPRAITMVSGVGFRRNSTKMSRPDNALRLSYAPGWCFEAPPSAWSHDKTYKRGASFLPAGRLHTPIGKGPSGPEPFWYETPQNMRTFRHFRHFTRFLEPTGLLWA